MILKIILTVITISASPFIISSIVNAAPYGVGAYNANVPYGGETQLSVSTSGAITVPINPSDTGTLGTASGTVTVTSTDVTGYKLYIRAVSSSNLTNGAAVLGASTNVSAAALATNSWGYNLDGTNNFLGVTTSDALLRTRTGPYKTGDTTTVTYGVKIDRSKPAGSYSTTIMYTAIPQTN